VRYGFIAGVSDAAAAGAPYEAFTYQVGKVGVAMLGILTPQRLGGISGKWRSPRVLHGPIASSRLSIHC
jgi:hypothetical protein